MKLQKNLSGATSNKVHVIAYTYSKCYFKYVHKKLQISRYFYKGRLQNICHKWTNPLRKCNCSDIMEYLSKSNFHNVKRFAQIFVPVIVIDTDSRKRKYVIFELLLLHDNLLKTRADMKSEDLEVYELLGLRNEDRNDSNKLNDCLFNSKSNHSNSCVKEPKLFDKMRKIVKGYCDCNTAKRNVCKNHEDNDEDNVDIDDIMVRLIKRFQKHNQFNNNEYEDSDDGLLFNNLYHSTKQINNSNNNLDKPKFSFVTFDDESGRESSHFRVPTNRSYSNYTNNQMRNSQMTENQIRGSQFTNNSIRRSSRPNTLVSNIRPQRSQFRSLRSNQPSSYNVSQSLKYPSILKSQSRFSMDHNPVRQTFSDMPNVTNEMSEVVIDDDCQELENVQLITVVGNDGRLKHFMECSSAEVTPGFPRSTVSRRYNNQSDYSSAYVTDNVEDCAPHMLTKSILNQEANSMETLMSALDRKVNRGDMGNCLKLSMRADHVIRRPNRFNESEGKVKVDKDDCLNVSSQVQAKWENLNSCDSDLYANNEGDNIRPLQWEGRDTSSTNLKHLTDRAIQTENFLYFENNNERLVISPTPSRFFERVSKQSVPYYLKQDGSQVGFDDIKTINSYKPSQYLSKFQSNSQSLMYEDPNTIYQTVPTLSKDKSNVNSYRSSEFLGTNSLITPRTTQSLPNSSYLVKTKSNNNDYMVQDKNNLRSFRPSDFVDSSNTLIKSRMNNNQSVFSNYVNQTKSNNNDYICLSTSPFDYILVEPKITSPVFETQNMKPEDIRPFTYHGQINNSNEEGDDVECNYKNKWNVYQTARLIKLLLLLFSINIENAFTTNNNNNNNNTSSEQITMGQKLNVSRMVNNNVNNPVLNNYVKTSQFMQRVCMPSENTFIINFGKKNGNGQELKSKIEHKDRLSVCEKYLDNLRIKVKEFAEDLRKWS